MHQTKIVASKCPPKGGALSSEQLLGRALIHHGKHQPINRVHNHAQNGELVLLYKAIQETQEAAIGLMKSIKGPQIQRHERPRNVCKGTFSLQSML